MVLKESNKIREQTKKLKCKVIIDRCHTIDKPNNIYKEECDAIIYSFRKILPVYNAGAYWLKNSNKEKLKINKLGISDLFFVIFNVTINFLKKIKILKLFYMLKWIKNKNIKSEIKKEKLGVNFLLHYFYFNPNFIYQVISIRKKNFNKIFDVCFKNNIQSLYDKCERDEVPQLYPVFKNINLNVKKLKLHGINSFMWPGKELPDEVRNSSDFPIANYLNENLLMLPIHQKLNKKN